MPPVEVSGVVTLYKVLRGRSLREMEALLGFKVGRLAKGAMVLTPTVLPQIGQFTTPGSGQVTGHGHAGPAGLDMTSLAQNAMATWSLTGDNRLIKIQPTIGHNPALSNDEQDPPGSGIPQWCLTAKLPGKVLATLHTYTAILRV